MRIPLWLIYALAAAISAASINIFGKIGMRHIDADVATAVRSVIQAAFVVVFAFLVGSMAKLPTLRGRPFDWMMLGLAGVAGGLSWIFAFRAIQLSQVTLVAPVDKLSLPLGIILAVIILRERPSLVNWFGIVLIVVGVYLTIVPRH